MHLTKADSRSPVSAKLFFQAPIKLVKAPCPTVNVIQRTHDINFQEKVLGGSIIFLLSFLEQKNRKDSG